MSSPCHQLFGAPKPLTLASHATTFPSRVVAPLSRSARPESSPLATVAGALVKRHFLTPFLPRASPAHAAGYSLPASRCPLLITRCSPPADERLCNTLYTYYSPPAALRAFFVACCWQCFVGVVLFGWLGDVPTSTSWSLESSAVPIIFLRATPRSSLVYE